MKLHLLSQQGKESSFLYCVFFSVCGCMQQPSALCRQCISARTPPAASGLRSGPAGWFCSGQELPSSCSSSGLPGTEYARSSLGSWQVDFTHLPSQPCCRVELAHLPCKITSSWDEGHAATFPGSVRLLYLASCAMFSLIFFSSDCFGFFCFFVLFFFLR